MCPLSLQGLSGSPFVVLGLFNNYGIAGVIGGISGMYIVVTLLMVFAGGLTKPIPVADVTEVEADAQTEPNPAAAVK